MNRNTLYRLLAFVLIASFVLSACTTPTTNTTTPNQSATNVAAWNDAFFGEGTPEPYVQESLAEWLNKYIAEKCEPDLLDPEEQVNCPTDEQGEIIEVQTSDLTVVVLGLTPVPFDEWLVGSLAGVRYVKNPRSTAKVIETILLVSTYAITEYLDQNNIAYAKHSDPTHNQTDPATVTAKAAVTTFYVTATTNGGPDPDKWRCLYTVMADGVVRVSLVVQDVASSAGAYLHWWEIGSSTSWGAYEKSWESIEKMDEVVRNGGQLKPGKGAIQRYFETDWSKCQPPGAVAP